MMRKTIAWILLFALLLTSPGTILAEENRVFTLQNSGENTEDAGSITVMVYFSGNDLESKHAYASMDILEILKTKYNSDKVHVTMATGGAKAWALKKDGIMNIPSDEVVFWGFERGGVIDFRHLPDGNMGDPETLTGFINDSVQRYPADRYALVLWNHGGGPHTGLCFDENMGEDGLALPELRSALSGTPFEGEEKLSFVAMSVCLLGSAEAAIVCAPYANYLIASEESMYAPDLDFSFLAKADTLDDAALCQLIAEGYREGVRNDNTLAFLLNDLSISVISLAHMNEVEEALNAFAREMPDPADFEAWLDVNLRRGEMDAFGGDNASFFDLVDLYSVAEAFETEHPDAAERLKKAIKEAVVYSWANIGYANGLTVYFPYEGLVSYLLYQGNFREIGFAEDFREYANSLMETNIEFLVQAGSISREAVDSLKQEFGSGHGYAVELADLFDSFRVEDAGDGTFRVSLDLTPEQRRLIVSAELAVAEASMYTSYNGYYPFDYAEIPLDDNGVHAEYTPRALYIRTESGDAGMVSYARRNGYYFIPVTESVVSADEALQDVLDRFQSGSEPVSEPSEDPETEYAWIVCRAAEDGKGLDVLKTLGRDRNEIFPDDEKLHNSNSSLGLDSKRFPWIYIVNFGLFPIETASGKVRPMDTWAGSQSEQGGLSLAEVDNARAWSLEFGEAASSASDRYVQLILTDAMGYRHASRLVRLPNPNRVSRTEPDQVLYEDEDGNRISVSELCLVNDSRYHGILMTLSCENHTQGDDTLLACSIQDLRTDGEIISRKNYAWNGPETVVTEIGGGNYSETFPKGTWEYPIYISLEELPESVSDHVGTIAFDLAVYSVDPKNEYARTVLMGEDDGTFDMAPGATFDFQVDYDLTLIAK